MRYKEEAFYYIYELIDPRSRLPRYVGCTLSMEQRYNQHLAGDLSNAAKNTWIEELKSLDLIPLVRELEQVQGTIDIAEKREVYWIRHHLNEGMALFNVHHTPTKPLKKVTFYLTEAQEDKLDALEIEFRQRHKRKVNRNEIVRLLIDQCDIDSLADLAKLPK